MVLVAPKLGRMSTSAGLCGGGPAAVPASEVPALAAEEASPEEEAHLAAEEAHADFKLKKELTTVSSFYIFVFITNLALPYHSEVIILSAINTAAHAATATVKSPFSRYAKIKATTKPHSADKK